MKATFTINMDNAAFDGNPILELRRILMEFCATRLHDHQDATAIAIRDLNGNTVGMLELVED